MAGGEALGTPALIHEAHVRLAEARGFESRGNPLGAAAIAMRRILIDRARAQLTARRGGGVEEAALDEMPDFVVEGETTVLGVHEVPERRAAAVEVVGYRCFAGYGETETSELSVQRDWATARAWPKKGMVH
jgi:hypothetical protein